MKKILLGSFICFLAMGSAIAQEAQHVVKINLSSLAFRNFSFQYEKPFHERMSGALGIGFMPTRSLPSYFGGGPDFDPKMNAFFLTPEFRFYVGRKGAPKGFYLAPYLRYTRFKITMETDVISSVINMDLDEKLFAKMTGFGVGFMLGSQWLIGDKFSIDWWIVGAHYGTAKYSAGIEGNFNLTPSEQDMVEDGLKEVVGNVNNMPGMGTVNTEVTANSAGFSIKGPFTGTRALLLAPGFTIGWAF